MADMEFVSRLGALPRTGAKTLARVALPDGRRAVRKSWDDTDPAERLRREAAILERLRGVEGVPVLLEPTDGTALLLADLGGERVRGPLPPGELRRLAIDLARILARVHERGVVHKNVNPGNVYRTPGGP